MSSSYSRREYPDNPVLATILRVLYAIRGSFLVFVFTLGVIWLVMGIAMQEGVMAGMLGIWGVSAMLYAVLGRLGLRLIGYTR